MTKIYYDQNGLDSLVNNGLESAIVNLKQTIRITSRMSVPYNFNYRTYSKNLQNSIQQQLNILEETLNMINNSRSDFSSINNNTKTMVTSIENYNIYLRNSAIKLYNCK